MPGQGAQERVVAGSRAITQVSEIALKHRMKFFMPPTAYIGSFESANVRDRMIYTDPMTAKLVVRKIAITMQELHQFIDHHMQDTCDATNAFMGSRVRSKHKEEGIVAPKFVLKTMEKFGKNAFTRVYFDKNHLI